MTNTEHSTNFLYGIAMLSKYKTENYSVNVIELSGISIEGLRHIPQKEIEDMSLLGWNVYNASDKDESMATYYKLEYVDT